MTVTVDRVRRLENPILNYAWGSKTAIAGLTGRTVPSSQPEAEMWMGSHPKAPSTVYCEGRNIPLGDLVARCPEAILGAEVANRFANQLPFLFKVLAAAEPLSIQAHPNQNQARIGFLRENKAGIPLDAPHRNYRDDNHKPEIICALTEFWGMSGFRTIDDLHRQLKRFCPETLLPLFSQSHHSPPEEILKHLFNHMLTMLGQKKTNAIAEALHQGQNQFPDDPITPWLMKLNMAYPGDIGVLAPMILNLVCLQPGQAMYLPAGLLHAYLDGVGIELMANSDNVLRGGLTPKHIDQDELMQVLRFEPHDPGVMTAQPRSPTESGFPTSAEEFSLAQLTVGPGVVHEASHDHNVEILLLTNGQAVLETTITGERLELSRGESVLIPAAAGPYRVSGRAEIYRATVPNA